MRSVPQLLELLSPKRPSVPHVSPLPRKRPSPGKRSHMAHTKARNLSYPRPGGRDTEVLKAQAWDFISGGPQDYFFKELRF